MPMQLSSAIYRQSSPCLFNVSSTAQSHYLAPSSLLPSSACFRLSRASLCRCRRLAAGVLQHWLHGAQAQRHGASTLQSQHAPTPSHSMRCPNAQRCSCIASCLPPHLPSPPKKRSRAHSTNTSTDAGSPCPTCSTSKSIQAHLPAASHCK